MAEKERPNKPKFTKQVYDIEAEKQVVGAILKDPSVLSGIDLDLHDFYIIEYRQIYEAALSLCSNGGEISQGAIARMSKVEPHWLSGAVAVSDPSECLYYAETVKEYGRSRRLISLVKEAVQHFSENDSVTSIDLADQIRVGLESFKLPSKKARSITVQDPKIINTIPPSYVMTVSTFAGDISSEVEFLSADLDSPKNFRRKIRECITINPVLPKDFDAFIHDLLQKAEIENAPGDTSKEESICYWIAEWFSTATEAETIHDLTQGYIEKHMARWFSPDRLVNYISERRKERINRNDLWSVIRTRGGRRQDKVIRLGDKTVRLWGLDMSFFEKYSTPVAEEDQLAMGIIEEDLSWLEQ